MHLELKTHCALLVPTPCDVKASMEIKWKLNGKKLSNQYGGTLGGNWELPNVGTPGTIQNTNTGDDGYLSVNNEFVGESVQKQQGKKTSPSKLYYLGLWKLEGTTFSTQTGIILPGNWEIPSVGTSGTIQNTATEKYLSVNGIIEDGSVVVEESLDSNDVGQQWERSANDDSGFFKIKIPDSGLFLTMRVANSLKIGT